MNARQVVLLAVAAGGIAAALWLGQAPGPDDAGDGERGVLPGLKSKLNVVTLLVLSRGDGTKVTLSRAAEAWIVAERGYAADVSRIRRLLLDLSGLEIVERKTANPQNYPRLGVEDADSAQAAGTRVDVTAGASSFSLIVGKTAGGRGVYARVIGTGPALLVRPTLAVETDAALWLDRKLIDLPADKIAEIAVTPAHGNAYTATGSEAGLRSSILAPLNFDDVARAAASAAATTRPQVVVRTVDGLAITLVGREADGQRWIAVHAVATGSAAAAEARALAARVAGFEFRIPEYRYEELFRTRD